MDRPWRCPIICRLSVLAIFSNALLGAQPAEGQDRINREIEVMESILATTVSLVEKEVVSELGTDAGSRDVLGFLHLEEEKGVEGLFLTDQGVVFTIGIPALEKAGGRLRRLQEQIARIQVRNVENPELVEMQVDLIENQMELTRQQLEELALAAAQLGTRRAPTPPLPPAPPLPQVAATPPQAPAPEVEPEEPAARAERVRERLHRAQLQLEQTQAQLEERRQRTEEIRKQIKTALIEAVSRHGDSLTQLEPRHYINLILISQDHFSPFFEEESGDRIVLSIKKADILAFKAGNIDYPAFESRVIESR